MARSFNQEPGFTDESTRPFESNELFMSRIRGSSRFLRRNPELRTTLADTLTASDDQSLLDAAELIALAQAVDSPANQTPVGALFDHLNLCGEIDQIRVGAAGEEGSTTRSAFLMQESRIQIISTIDESNRNTYLHTCEFLYRRLTEVQERGLLNSQASEWLKGRISDFFAELLTEQRNTECAAQLPYPDQRGVEDETVADDSSEIELLMQMALAHQRYGVKNGYVQSTTRPGTFLYASPSIIEEFSSEKDSPHPLHFRRSEPFVAYVGDSRLKSHAQSLTLVNDIDGSIALDNSQGIRALYKLKPTGEIDFAVNRGQSFLELARASGRYETYRAIQAEIIANYIDLVCRDENELLANTTQNKRRQSPRADSQSGMDIVRTLLIPRIQKLTQQSPIGEEKPREVRLHGVVWHIRKLPSNHRASPQAQEIARQAGISLADGETFVRAHQRGAKELGRIATNRFLQR